MKRLMILLLSAGYIACAPCLGHAAEETSSSVEPHGILHKLVMYVPNRVLDMLDVVRLRARVGPGVALNVRVTNLAAVFLGSYQTVYAGLPGPRNGPTPKLPIGFEHQTGAQVSIADVTAEGAAGPDYGPAEIGLGAHVLLVGLDAGVEPLELLDLVAGLFFIDLRADDL
jgi:hypothetical protein